MNNDKIEVGFRKASGSEIIKPSDESVLKAQKLIGETNDKIEVGFRKASGSEIIKPSDESLLKAQKLVGDGFMEHESQSLSVNTVLPIIPDFNFSQCAVDSTQSILSQRSQKAIYSSNSTPNSNLNKSPLSKYSPSMIALKMSTNSVVQSNNTQTLNSPSKSMTKKVFRAPKSVQPDIMEPKPQSVSHTNKIQNVVSNYSFPDNRKNLKSMSLTSKFQVLDSSSMIFSPKEAELFRFSDRSFAGYNDVYVSLLDKKIDSLLLKPSWVKNHYKWVVWKLKSYDMLCKKPDEFLTYDNVVNELLYRYHSESFECKRSCVKLILEKDGPPNVYMVLLVSDILADGVIELTDGWYSIRASIDIYLKEMIDTGLITIGNKLRICCAQIEGEEASDPLDTNVTSKLLLRINNVRRSRWAVPLGYQKTALFPVTISSLYPNGGKLPYIDVVIQKKLPLMFKEIFKDANASCVIRNQEEQNQYESNIEQEIADKLDSMKQVWLKEFEEEYACENPSLKGFSGSQDINFASIFANPNNKSNSESMMVYQKDQEDFIRDKIESFLHENQVSFMPFCVLYVTDLCPEDHEDAEITLWRPSIEQYDSIQEGQCVRFFGLDVGETKSNRLFTKGNVSFEFIDPPPQNHEFVFRKRFPVRSFSDFVRFALFELSPGILFDIIGIIIVTNETYIILTDGSSILCHIELSKKRDYLNQSLLYIENLKFVSFNPTNGIVYMESTNQSVFYRSPPKGIINIWDLYLTMKRHMNFSLLKGRVESIQLGKPEPPSYIFPENSLFFSKSNYSIISGISDINTIELCITQNGKTVMFNGGFTDSTWKSEFIQNNSVFNEGFSIVLPLCDGISSMFVVLNDLAISSFFSEIAQQIESGNRQKLISFFEEFFELDVEDELKIFRKSMQEHLQLDISNLEFLLRTSFFYSHIVYSDSSSIELMNVYSSDPVFPFRYNEWKNLVSIFSSSIILMQFEFSFLRSSDLLQCYKVSYSKASQSVDHLQNLLK